MSLGLPGQLPLDFRTKSLLQWKLALEPPGQFPVDFLIHPYSKLIEINPGDPWAVSCRFPYKSLLKINGNLPWGFLGSFL